jgi:hypothetical protein
VVTHAPLHTRQLRQGTATAKSPLPFAERHVDC